MSFVTRGFHGRRGDVPAERVPPGQCVTTDFPVFSAGPTPGIALDEWSFTVTDAGGDTQEWTWSEFTALPRRG